MMKKVISIMLTAALVLCFASCGEPDAARNTTAAGKNNNTTEAAESQIETETSTEATTELTTKKPVPKTTEAKTTEDTTKIIRPAKPIVQSKQSVYGKRTGTKKTYTGLSPLPTVTLPVTDPKNTRGLSEKAVGHSFGVSTGGKPHSISVNNQKIYEKYGGLCLDTSGEKVIYLTFDCGYENGCTSEILDTLKAKGVPAAFFVTLPYINSVPELVARMINEGHTVGNHSDSHPNFANISRTRMAEEIEAVDNCLRTKFGYSSPFFRFPEGSYSVSALDLVQSTGFTSVFWSSAYADWDTSKQNGADYAFDTVTSRLHPGCVLLLHAVSRDNTDALGRIIDWAEGQGYTFKAL